MFGVLQEGGHGTAAKALSRDENELVVQQLLLEGCLLLDFGHTAYTTNVYLKLGPRAAVVLEVRVLPFFGVVPCLFRSRLFVVKLRMSSLGLPPRRRKLQRHCRVCDLMPL